MEKINYTRIKRISFIDLKQNKFFSSILKNSKYIIKNLLYMQQRQKTFYEYFHNSSN